MTRRRTWGHMDESDRERRTKQARLYVRCRRNRILAANWTPRGQRIRWSVLSKPPLPRHPAQRIEDVVRLTSLLDGEVIAEDMPAGLNPCPCPHHPDGHLIDEDRLREEAERLNPPGRHGKAPSIDVSTVLTSQSTDT